MEMIHVKHSYRDWDSERVAREGGWHNVTSSKAMHLLLDNKEANGILSNMSEARRIAAYNPTIRPLKFSAKWRVDIMDPTVAEREGHDLPKEWVLRGVTDEQARATILMWHQAGHHIRLHEGQNLGAWGQWYETEGGKAQVYWDYKASDPQDVKMYNLVMDLRNEDYRAHCVVHALSLCNMLGLDGLYLDAKAGWMMDGSPARATPDFNTNHGGVLYPSPYGPQEWEYAFDSMVRELGEAGVPVILVHRPPRPQDEEAGDVWSYLSGESQRYALGELG